MNRKWLRFRGHFFRLIVSENYDVFLAFSKKTFFLRRCFASKGVSSKHIEEKALF